MNKYLLYGRPPSVFQHPPVISFDTEARHSQMNYPSHEILHKTSKHWSGKWIKHIPVISTAHIEASDGKMLEENYYPILDSYSDGAAHLLPTTTGTISHHWTDTFRNLLTKFSALGYRWIILDGEGDKVDGLETFDW